MSSVLRRTFDVGSENKLLSFFLSFSSSLSLSLSLIRTHTHTHRYVEALIRFACETFRSKEMISNKVSAKIFSSSYHSLMTFKDDGDGDGGGEKDKVVTIYECFLKFCETYLFPNAMRHDADMFRTRLFGNKTVNDTLVRYWKPLLEIFMYYTTHSSSSSSDSSMSSTKTMTKKDFVCLVRDLNLVKFGFTFNIVSDIFESIQHHRFNEEDEEEKEKKEASFNHKDDSEVTFMEFIEALAACACVRYSSPYEPLENKFTSIVKDLIRYAKRQTIDYDDFELSTVMSSSIILLLKESGATGGGGFDD